MAQMQRFVGVWRRIFYHYAPGILRRGYNPEVIPGFHFSKEIEVIGIGKHDIQKTLNYIKEVNFSHIFNQVISYFLSKFGRIGFYQLQHRKDHQGNISFKIFTGGLKFGIFYFNPVKRFDRFFYFF